MKVAIPIWNSRVSPVLDAAGQLLVVQIENGTEQTRQTIGLATVHPGWRAHFIAEMGVDTLICGALSRHLERLLTATGITVCPWISGEVEEVLSAFGRGKLNDESFSMPGYCRRGGPGRRRQRGNFGRGRR
jgi:predicted Fe-Mo cluster-binding NifX family protein